MKIKMLRTMQASLNGIQVRRFQKGHEYTEVDEVDINTPQYKLFIYGKDDITRSIIDAFLESKACEIIEDKSKIVNELDEDVDILDMDEDGNITSQDNNLNENDLSNPIGINTPIINRKKKG